LARMVDVQPAASKRADVLLEDVSVALPGYM